MWKTFKKALQALFEEDSSTSRGPEKRHYQTFTYFIPGPKQDVSGYREKQLDKALHKFLSQGWDIVDFNTQAYTGKHAQGMWVIFLVSTQSTELKDIDLESFEPEAFESSKDKDFHQHPPSQSKGPVNDLSTSDVEYEVEPDEEALKSTTPGLERKK